MIELAILFAAMLAGHYIADAILQPGYLSQAKRSDDPMPVILGLVGAGVFCIVAGLIAMPYTAPLIERNIGVVIDNPNDLRPIGGIIGLLVGLFIGAIGMWVSAPGK